LALPFYKLGVWAAIAQILAAIKLLIVGVRLFSGLERKERKINILLAKNGKVFKPETFAEYMQAPCGRLVVKVVLSRLNKETEYKCLLKLKKPLFSTLKENCKTTETIIYRADEKNEMESVLTLRIGGKK